MEASRGAIANPPPSGRGFVIPPVALGVGAIVIVTVLGGMAACFIMPTGSDAERGTRALVEAFSQRRLIEPRLSGGFKAGHFNPDTSDTSEIDGGKLNDARDLLTEAGVSGDAPSQLAYGRLLLLDGKGAVAVKRIRAVVKAQPESAEARNDLGVCLIQARKLEEAIVEFDAALTHKAEMPEALFNRALCYRRLLLTDPAGADLKRFVQTETDKDWLSEAKQRLEEVSRPPTLQSSTGNKVPDFDEAVANGDIEGAKRLASQNYQLIRRHAILDVTPQQLRAAVEGRRAEAERLLVEIELIGSVLIETKNDALIADAAGYLRALKASEQVTELELVTDLIDAQRNFELNKGADSATFHRAFVHFRERRNQAFELLSAFQLAESYYHAKRYRESIEIIKSTLTSFEGREWPYDRARLLTQLALETSLLGQDSLAIKYFEQALSFCNSTELEPRILQYMSVPYLRLGDFDTSLERLRDSTELLLENGLPSGIYASLGYNYEQIATIYSLRREHALALLYAEQAVKYADQATSVADYAAEFSSFLAVQQARLNRLADAEAQLKRAFDYLERIEGGRTRDFTEANVLINAGEVAVQSGNAAHALKCYEKAEALIPRDESEGLQMIDILRGRAEANFLEGQNESAHSDLMRAISLIENYRANVDKSEQRIQFLASSHNVFDQLISLDLSVLDLRSEAFEMSEQFRARALLEEISRENASNDDRIFSGSGERFPNSARLPAFVIPLKLSAIQSGLPDNLTLLTYSVTAKRTYLFLVNRHQIKVRESLATTEILDRLVPDYVADLRQMGPIEEVNEKARTLYDYLIKPVEEEIAGNTSICVVPDEALHFLPFAALRDQQGKYLIESHRLVYAPSASVLVRCIKESQTQSPKEAEKILAVGNPQFNGEDSRLPPLPEAETESMESARLYAPSMIVLRGSEATEPTVRAALTDCDVAHFAVHCLVEEGSPDLAALVLANGNPNSFLRASSEPAEAAGSQTMRGSAIARSAALSKAFPQDPMNDPNDGLLFLKELYGLKLPRTRLVVLSACQSGLGQYYRGEGIVSLVRPFLAAGVPVIMASLWSIDSKATTHLMIEFHKQRKLSGMQEGDALRFAQIQMAQSGSYQHPFHWAPFIVIGSGN